MSNANDTPARTSPIPITQRRRASIASSIPALSTSPNSPFAASIQTPSSTLSNRMGSHSRASSDNGGGGSPTSPLAYFLGAATSPIKTTAGTGFPFNATKSANGPVIDEDEESPPAGSTIGLFGVGAHTRRGSWAQSGPFAGAAATATKDRGANVLRRLSLSTAFQRPQVNSPTMPSAPPPSSVATTTPGVPTLGEPRVGRKARAGTLSVSDPSKKRGISPMGERLLKGHFDGFI